MKKYLQCILTLVVFFLAAKFCSIGIRHTCENLLDPQPRIVRVTQNETPKETTGGWQLKEPSDSAEFISGPLVADVGELCIFRLNDPKTQADWVVVRQIDKEPPATFYIDSTGSALSFSSNITAKYTIVAAIVEEGKPRILQHIFQYGMPPNPTPGPNPEPDPSPTPEPQPERLSDWVRQNIPKAGKPQAMALASCYESAASAIEKGTINTPEAAFSAIRTNTQTKIKVEVWKDFLEQLSGKITVELGEAKDIKKLGTIFSEISVGLKTVSGTEIQPGDDLTAPIIPPFTPPYQTATCPDPTGKACQPQPTIQYRRIFR